MRFLRFSTTRRGVCCVLRLLSGLSNLFLYLVLGTWNPPAPQDSSPVRDELIDVVGRSVTDRDKNRTSCPKADSEPTPSHAIQEETDLVQGDLLNGVGSASSTSTASSVFSASNRMPSSTRQYGAHQSTSWTPLTQVDASPSRDAMNSPKRDQSCRVEGYPVRRDGHTSPGLHGKPIEASGLEIRPSRNHLSARPGQGEIKGERIKYDPELDKKLSKKDMRVTKPVWENFGQQVFVLPSHRTTQPPHFCNKTGEC